MIHRTPLLRLLLAVAAATALVASLVGPAAAASKPKPAAPKPAGPSPQSDPANPALVVNSWALAPSGASPAEPSTRPTLTYEVSPGAVINDSLTLFNYGNVQLTFRIYATDAFNNFDGQFDLLTGDTAPRDVGTWVTLPQTNITVPAKTSAVLPITIAVPADARPGDHVGAVLAASPAMGTGPDGKIVALDRRTGTRMYVRVAGALTPKLDVVKIRSVFHPTLNPAAGSLDVTYTVRNSGNARLAAHQALSLRAPLVGEVDRATPPDLPEILPGNEVTLHARFDHAPAGVALSTRISVTPLDDSLPKAGSVRTGRALAPPWTILTLLACAGLIAAARRAYLRRRVAPLLYGETVT